MSEYRSPLPAQLPRVQHLRHTKSMPLASRREGFVEDECQTQEGAWNKKAGLLLRKKGGGSGPGIHLSHSCFILFKATDLPLPMSQKDAQLTGSNMQALEILLATGSFFLRIDPSSMLDLSAPLCLSAPPPINYTILGPLGFHPEYEGQIGWKLLYFPLWKQISERSYIPANLLPAMQPHFSSEGAGGGWGVGGHNCCSNGNIPLLLHCLSKKP